MLVINLHTLHSILVSVLTNLLKILTRSLIGFQVYFRQYYLTIILLSHIHRYACVFFPFLLCIIWLLGLLVDYLLTVDHRNG